ncbi:Abi family protein [Vibrio cholerae]
MNWNDLERLFSPARLGRYRAARAGNTAEAALDYTYNLQLSEAMMPMLNVLEIALRNGIHVRLSSLYGRKDWWEVWVADTNFNWQNKEISNAKAKLNRRHEPQTPDKIIAELTFGFWSSLFNTQFQHILWKDLRLVFTRCPKHQRKRHNISSALNQIRDLRNRVFHHEPLLWLTPTLIQQHAVGVMVINWLEPDLALWLNAHDRLPAKWVEWDAT